MIPRDDQSEPPDEPLIYDIEEPVLPRPDLPGQVIVSPTADEVIDVLAADLVLHAENCVRQFGDFHLALSGGEVFDQLYQRLMYDPNYRRLPWRRTHLWFVEERCVPLDDDRANYRLISETIGDHADIPREQFHPILAQSSTADREYEAKLRDALGWREKGQDRLDYALLTIDTDGCTAGLFPDTVAAPGKNRLVQFSPCADPAGLDRVTMTCGFLNAARLVAVLATGPDVSAAVDHIARNRDGHASMPIQQVAPINGELRWYLDSPACGRADR